MKKQCVALASCVVSVFGCAAEDAAPTFTAEQFRAHVAFLADDLLEGRDTGSRGHEIAARYVATEFASYGLQPGGVDGWFQQVPLQKTTRGADRGSITIIGPQGERVFAHGEDALAYVSERESEVELEARVVFAPRGFELPVRVRIRGSNQAEKIFSPNVVAILPGSDPRLAKEYVVLSAHLDHLGMKDVPSAAPGADRIYNGALDNAAGIATLLEVARAAAAMPTRPRRSLLFLATTAEEQGLLGADYFAHFPTVPIEQIVGNVDLDMPLLTYDFTDVIAFGANHSTVAKFVEQAVAPMNVKLSPDPFPEQGMFTRSDHYEFVRQGVPAVFLVTGMENGGTAAWEEFQASFYHRPQDDMALKVDWKAGAKFAEANYRITRAMADSLTPPLWYEGDYFGDAFAPKAGRAKR